MPARELRAPARIVWAVEQLAPAASDRILEIGCGPGHAVALVCQRVSKGVVTAIDRSALQVEKARMLNREHVQAGRARIEALTLEGAPAALGARFTKVLAVNVNAFWTEPVASLASLRSLLGTRGRVFLVHEAPSAAGLKKLRVAVPAALAANGFVVDDVRVASSGAKSVFGVVSRKSGR